MRSIAVLFFCWQVFAGIVTANAETFPYKTFVAADDVHVRSGPGQNYYPTDKLRRGQEVEVYRHDPGGWCAIRPVESSFTWVSGRYLKPTEDNLAVVTEEGVSARVGSRFSDIRDVIQVRLQKGELVEVIDAPPRGSGWGENVWFKIAPPSGEFRWVSAKYLDAEYPRDGIRNSAAQSGAGRRRADAETADAPEGSSAPRIPAEAMAGARSLSPEQFEAELQRIELELSMMVVEEPAGWSFDALRDRTNLLLDAAQTAVERGCARHLANKIARFDDIKQRQDAVLATRYERDRPATAPQTTDAGANTVAGIQVDGRFDGVGQLTQVESAKLGSPRYALMGESGDVRCYVTPAPGVNLRDYVGRKVGVVGTRGYMPEQHASHIMARRVTSLERTIVR